MGTWVACSNPPDSSGLSHYLYACQRLTADGRDRSGKDGLRVQSGLKTKQKIQTHLRRHDFGVGKICVCIARACHSLRFYVGEDEIVGRVYTGSLSQRAGGVCQTSQFLVAWMFLNRSLHHPRKEEWLARLKWRLVLV